MISSYRKHVVWAIYLRVYIVYVGYIFTSLQSMWHLPRIGIAEIAVKECAPMGERPSASSRCHHPPSSRSIQNVSMKHSQEGRPKSFIDWVYGPFHQELVCRPSCMGSSVMLHREQDLISSVRGRLWIEYAYIPIEDEKRSL